jgi:hypothetical protein
MKVALWITAFRRRSMPGADEVRALLERVITTWNDLKRVWRGVHQIEKPAAIVRPARGRFS